MDLVGRWPAPLRQKLVTELAQWPTQQLQPLIIAVEQHLTITYFEHDNQIDAATYQAVKFLSIIAEANDQSKAVSYTKFYLDIINSEDFDVKRDYVSWKRPGLVSDSVFSFCHYPFVYDPASKSDILAYENTGEMREQFHDAIFESFFTGGSCPYLVLRVSVCASVYPTAAFALLKSLRCNSSLTAPHAAQHMHHYSDRKCYDARTACFPAILLSHSCQKDSVQV